MYCRLCTTALTFVVLLVLTLPQKAFSIPTQSYWIPQTRTLVEGEVKFDLAVLQTLDKSTSGGHRSVWGISSGIWDWNNFSAEVGLDWNEPTYDTAMHAISTHGKLAYKQIDVDIWAVAIGFDHFALREGYYDYNMYYLVFQNRIGDDWITELGGYAGNELRLRTSSGVLVGVWKRIQDGEGDMGVEWMSGQGQLGYLMPGVRVQIRDGVEGVVSYGFAGQRDQHRDILQLRISIYF